MSVIRDSIIQRTCLTM